MTLILMYIKTTNEKQDDLFKIKCNYSKVSNILVTLLIK
jgi:hypothetical protein